MSTDELLDAHMQRLRTDPGYVAIWRRAHEQPNMSEIVMMLAWAAHADGLRAMAQAASTHASPELAELLDRGLKYGIVGCDCYSTACVHADEIRKLIGEART